MQCVAVTRPGEVALVDMPVPQPGPYEALVRTQAAYLCNATDRKLVTGHFPGIGPEKYPLTLGHETVGVVEAVGGKVRSFSVGDRVIGGLVLNPTDPRYSSGWGGFSEYVVATDHDAMAADGAADEAHGWLEVFQVMRPVPGDIPLEAAGLLCMWREVYAGFGDFQLKKTDSILVFGAGPVGMSFVRFARLFGFPWIGVVDPLALRREKALALGAHEAFTPDSPEIPGLGRRNGRGLDAVIDAVGSQNVINAAIPLVRMAGSVCVYGVVPTPDILLQKDRGPYNFTLFLHQWPTRAAERAAMEPLVQWLREGRLSHRDFLTREFPVRDIAHALKAADEPASVKTLLRF
jgi:threonine dehydrogenase-like Zn-dependent dehydrogenase